MKIAILVRLNYIIDPLFQRCETCGKGFLRRERYITHVRIHTGEKPFVCAVCQRGYRDKRELKKHQTSHNHSGQSDPIPGHTPLQTLSPISASSASTSTTTSAMTASNQSRQVQQTIGSGQQQVTKTIIIQQQAPGQPQTIQLQTPPKVFLCY